MSNKNKRKKYIQAPTTEDLVRIEAGEKFSDITAGPIKKALEDALDEDIKEIEDFTQTIEAPIQKVKRNSFKRRMYFTIGLVVSFMSIVGLIFSINFCVNFVKGIADNTAQKNEFAEFIYPVVIIDPPTFDGTYKLPSEVVLTAAVWDIILYSDDDEYTVDAYDNITVPAIDVEAHATKLFGTGLTFVHQTLGSSDLYFNYDESTKSYLIPATPHYVNYSPKVESMTRVGERYTLKVGYYLPVQAFMPNGEKTTADKYLEYVVAKRGDKFTIISVNFIGHIDNPIS